VLHEVIEHVTTLAYQLKKPKTRRVVFFVGLEVFGKTIDALGKNSDLDFGVTCVLSVDAKLADNGKFFFLSDIHDIRFRCYYAKVDRYSVSAKIDKLVIYPIN
jgi:hypothetical protein